jgi:hypothetical protein
VVVLLVVIVYQMDQEVYLEVVTVLMDPTGQEVLEIDL